jgi:hypothetical protein
MVVHILKNGVPERDLAKTGVACESKLYIHVIHIFKDVIGF